VTTVLMLGVMMDYVFKQPPRAEDADTKLRAILAIPTAHGIKDAFTKRFNVGRIVSGYGSTELCFPVLSPHQESTPPGACGKLAHEWYEMRLVDPATDEEVRAGEAGEAIVRPRVPWITTMGYAGQPDVTLRSMRNLWWHTNDLLKRDADGWYYFIDRADDSIRVRAENVSSYDLEEIILSHNAIAKCAVVGVATDVEAGEQELKACLVLQPGFALDFREFIAFCAERVPRSAVPRYVEVLADLPTNEHGKVRKSQLRSGGVSAATWDRLGDR